jgi:ATPase subunit of ABC transporter with duplicated ATPase domains
MEIKLTNAGKRYRFDWIFRNLNHSLSQGTKTALIGPNGSGKSTLLKTLAGHLSLSKGAIQFVHANGSAIPQEDIYQHISYTAPYIDLIEELTLEEAITFHAQLKPLLPTITPDVIFERLELPKTRQKELRFFSSGMKQRVKLALTIGSNTPVVLLDEPSTNLDVKAISWAHQLLDDWIGNRLLVIATNDPGDLQLCNQQLDITHFK